MDFTQHYLTKAKDISFFGIMTANSGDIILVPHKVSRTPLGNSVRLQPCTEFPSVRLSKFFNETQFAYLKPNMLFNGQAALPSKIAEMIFFLKPFDANIVREELRSLQCTNEAIEGFIQFFPMLQEETLKDSKLAQAGRLILDWKNTKQQYEQKIVQTMKAKVGASYNPHHFRNATDVYREQQEKRMNDSSMDTCLAREVTNNSPTNSYTIKPGNLSNDIQQFYSIQKDSLYNETLDMLLN